MTSILLLEDSHAYGAMLFEELQRKILKCRVAWITSEAEFLAMVPQIRQEPPDLLISDVMLRWREIETDGAREARGTEEVPGDVYLGGIRCVRRLQEYRETKDIPVILNTVLDRASLERVLAGLPSSVVHIQKSASHLIDLAIAMLNVRAEVQRQAPRVFLVHGHNVAAREAVARCLERIGLSVVILSEQASAGRTIVEQLEAYSDVSFAVVLLIGDDVGRAQMDGQLKARARQNVIFELGYFVARLGRERVCCLYEDGVEIPTDYQAVVYVPFDSAGAWKTRLAKELRASGLGVNASATL